MENIIPPPFPNEVSRSWFLSQELSKNLRAGVSSFLWVPDLRAAYTLKEHLNFFSPRVRTFVLPPFETDLLRNRGPSLQRKIERIRSFWALVSQSADLIILPVECLFQISPPLDFWKNHSWTVSLKEPLTKTALSTKLAQVGYLPTELVEHPFEFSVRGSIVDVFCPLYEYPLRFELFEDVVQSIRSFFPESQRKSEDLSSVTIVPTHEFLWPEHASELATLKSSIRLLLDQWDWDKNDREALLNRIEQKSFFHTIDYWGPLMRATLGHKSQFNFPAPDFIFDSNSIEKELRTIPLQLKDNFQKARSEKEWVPDIDYFLEEKLPELSKNSIKLSVSGMSSELFQSLDSLNYKIRSQAADQRGIPFEAFIENLRPFVEKGIQIIFGAFTQGAQDRLNFLLGSYHWTFQCFESFESARHSQKSLVTVVGDVDEGFLSQADQFIFIPESFIFETKRKLSRSRFLKSSTKLERKNFFSDDVFLLSLNANDNVVHKEHGVGKYLGLKSLNVGGITTEFLEIEYKDNHKLLVPITKLSLIQRHSSASDAVTLDRLGGQTWEGKKAKAKKELQSLAGELLNLYSIRALSKGPELIPKEDDLIKFATTFPYQETPDQAKAIEDTLKDLRGPRPMDRLVCGDVGYGKTEVAIRAAFSAISAGYQAAVLVPTTLLATQHENQFRKRFSQIGIVVAGLSRFKSHSEIKESLEGLKSGKIKIAIGTHKLLSQNVVFNNLGLLVIDEEQKFGVAHKEKLKKFRSNVHVLSMTATPIPRTLNLAMSGLRELSIITTPPQNRMSVRTFVSRKKESLIREAIENEIRRGGQVFYVHNRVQTIEKEFAFVAPLCPPKTTLDFAHGQMDESLLEKKMIDFYEGRTQVLISTSIIESGLDVPNANTLIVDRADAFGLAQLYQIRGRVGRSDVRGYAYFLVPEKATITDEAEERLRVLESYQELGSGFHIASHDLELRGAGEFLGREQSGSMSALGYDAYIDLLNECIAEIKGEAIETTFDPEMNLGIDITIPDFYIKDIGLRLSFYRKLSSCPDEAEIESTLEELEDRFGDLPGSVNNLITAMKIKSRLKKLGIRSITASTSGFSLAFDTSTRVNTLKMVQAVQKYPKHFQMNPDGRLLIRNLAAEKNNQKTLNHIHTMLDEIATWE
jgi:transcription-repair coupling factor (superfamily II helicase)